jgi:hypothetical protein
LLTNVPAKVVEQEEVKDSDHGVVPTVVKEIVTEVVEQEADRKETEEEKYPPTQTPRIMISIFMST